MNFAYYGRGLVMELKLESRSRAKTPDPAFESDLDEAIEAGLCFLRDSRQPFENITKGPPADYGVPPSSPLVKRWKARALETFKMFSQYRSMGAGRSRDILRDRLARRHIRLEAS